MSCGVGCRCGSDLALLWLWPRLAAVSPIRSLTWEPPYAADAALPEKTKDQKKKKKKRDVYRIPHDFRKKIGETLQFRCSKKPPSWLSSQIHGNVFHAHPKLEKLPGI